MRKIVILLVSSILLFLFSVSIYAHPGKTDGAGGHYDHQNGEYHYHHGYSAHSHTNGVCPYGFDDKTNHNSNDNHSNEPSNSNDDKNNTNNLYTNEKQNKKEEKTSPSLANIIEQIIITILESFTSFIFLWIFLGSLLYKWFPNIPDKIFTLITIFIGIASILLALKIDFGF